MGGAAKSLVSEGLNPPQKPTGPRQYSTTRNMVQKPRARFRVSHGGLKRPGMDPPLCSSRTFARPSLQSHFDPCPLQKVRPFGSVTTPTGVRALPLGFTWPRRIVLQPPPQFGEEIPTIRQDNWAGLFFGELLPSHQDYDPGPPNTLSLWLLCCQRHVETLVS